MTTAEFLMALLKEGVRVRLDGDRLVTEGPREALTAEKVAELRQRKAEILTFLKTGAKDGESKETPIERVNRKERLALSFGQQRLWFVDRIGERSEIYNMPMTLRLAGPLDADALHRSFQSLVVRHEVLRTHFPEEDGVPYQAIADPSDPEAWKWLEGDATTFGGDDGLFTHLGREARRPFNLATGPLFRASLYRCGEEEHVLQVIMHHAVSDGWSWRVFGQELSALYQAYTAGEPFPLEPLPIQYADFSAWQQDWLQGDLLDKQRAYWKERLAGVEPLELPTDRPRPATRSLRGAMQRFSFSPQLAEGLRTLGRDRGATQFMTLMAAFQVLLHRYSGQTDITVGMPIAGRNRPEVEGLMGMFVNTLAIRSDLSGDPRFDELLESVRNASLEAQAHQDVPFERLVEDLQPERDLSRSPLFQVLFAEQDAPGSGLELAGVETHPLRFDRGISELDLSFSVWEEGGGMGGQWTYSTDLFDGETIEAMQGHLETLLASIVADPSKRVSELELVPEDDRRRLMGMGAGREVAIPEGVCIHHQVEAWVDEGPERVAVEATDGVLSYGELETRANQLANYLIGLGVGPETLVGICLPRTTDMVVAVLAILKAGGAYVPLDTKLPNERLVFMLQDSGAVAAVTHGGLSGLLEGYDGPVVRLDGPERLGIDAATDERPSAPVRPDQLAYVIYTSGSTGLPKGVEVCHRSVINFFPAMGRKLGFSSQDTLLATAPLYFDPSVVQILGTLSYGGKLLLASEEQLADGGLVRSLIERPEVSLCGLTPPTWRMLLDAGWKGRDGLRIWTGGEALIPALARDLKAVCSEVWNMYGPTETTLAVTGWCIPDDAEEIRIGTALDNYRVYVVDEAMRLVPAGVPGELYVGGEGVARGYRNRPELTAERFVPDPFSDDPGARLYRTGDSVRFRRDGTLEFLGRLDTQVKIRGLRIELGEIEARLAEHESVLHTTVLLDGEGSGARLVAYVVTEDGESLTLPGMRSFLRGFLPDYMVPSLLVLLDEFPVTASGKVNRKALPKPDEQALAPEYVAPRTPTEETLARVWSDVLKVEDVGAYDDFFALGGHSLLATQVVSRLTAELGKEVSLKSLFEVSTLADLAERIDEATDAPSTGPAFIEPADRTERLPLSFAQQRLWFLTRMQEGSARYNMPITLRLRGPLQRDALFRSLEAIVERHEVLRTRFAEEDGVPYLEVLGPEAPGAWEWVEKDAEEMGGEDGLMDHLALEAERPFDVATGPLFRAGLYRLSDGDHVLQVVMHHTVSDGWSIGLLIRELGEVYGALAAGQPSPLAPLPIQYADFAVWQQEWMQGDVLDEQLDYWREQLAGMEALELPTDRPRPAVQEFEGAVHRFRLSPELTEGLKALGRENGTTLFMNLMAAYQVLLHRYTSQTDIAIGTPIAGRNRQEMERLVGMFVNTLVMRSDLSDDPTFEGLLKAVRESSLEAHARQDLPFEKLVEELQPNRDLSRTPLFQAMFVFQNAPWGDLALADVDAEPVRFDEAVAEFDLTLTVWEEGTGEEAADQTIDGVWVYPTAMFDRETMEALQRNFETLLEAIVADPSSPVSAFKLVPEEDRKLLVEWGTGQDLAFPREACIHDLFEARVDQHPDRVALVAQDGSLTYGELDAKANRLAHYLVGLGIGREMLVGVSLPRTTEMVAAVMGILKAGGAYVPLDPDLPEERVAYMLEDSGATVVITTEALAGQFGSYDGAVVRVDGSEGQEVRAGSPARPRVKVDPIQLAYVLFTSGSTGLPKGVEVCHHNVVAYVTSYAEYPGLTEDDVFMGVATLSFDVSVLEYFGTLSVGGKIALASWETVRDGPRLRAMLEGEGVTVGNCTPTTWYMLLNAGWKGNEKFRAWTGSEIVPPDLTKRLVVDCGEVWNLYGPTETTVTATGWLIPGDVDELPIGTPLPNYLVYVLDQGLDLLPVGVPGELCIGGPGVARGYRNRPDLTADRFVRNPYGPGRIYRTGDRVRWRRDGTIEFLGRFDNQVKVRGLRIELGEIEARLAEHDAVLQTAVVVDGDGVDARLVAYVVLEDGGDLDLAGMRESLRGFLPDYMIPNLLVEMPTFPLSPAGKIDQKALPVPDEISATLEFVAPRTPTERGLAAIWQEVLGIEGVGAHDDFFALGGHSLLATQVMSRVTREFEVELSLRSLFETSTLSALAERIDEAVEEVVSPIEPVGRDFRLPLSFAQQRLWFLAWMLKDSSRYNMPVTLRLRGPLDVDALRRSFEALVDRHEVLRTRFPDAEGVPYLDISEVGEPDAWRWVEKDVGELGGEEGLEAELNRAAGRPFDLASDPLFQVTLYRCAEEDHVLQVIMHHGVSDGWSISVLDQELSALYRAFVGGESSPLAPLPIQYADYAVWQQDWLRDDVLDEQLGYWRGQLEGVVPLDLPTDRPRPAVLSMEGETQRLHLSGSLAEGLRTLGRERGATLFMTLMAAFQVLLHRYSGQSDIAVGTPIAGRNRRELEGLIGMFVNTLVFRSDLGDDPTFEEFLGKVRETSLEAHAHQDLPFERLVEELQPERDLSRSPLFQAMFMFQNAPGRGLDLSGVEAKHLHVGGSDSEVDLTLTLWEEHAEEGTEGEPAGTSTFAPIAGSWTYPTALFDGETIETMQRHFETLLEAIVADPTKRISELELVPTAEKDQVRAWGTGPAIDLPEGVCVHHLFESQVGEHGDRVALKGEDGELTYNELEARANRWAWYFRGLGVGSEDLVGVNLNRTTEMVAAVLGVLKAGGAYLPLDPELPEERIAYMLEDSGAGVVVTSEEFEDLFGGFEGKLMRVDGPEGADIGTMPSDRPGVQVDPSQLAYVIYTSGSTGRPKGVEVGHRNVVNFLISMTKDLGLTAADKLMAVTTLSFDISVLELFGPLCVGGCTDVVSSDLTYTGEDLIDHLSASGATVAQATPATWHMMYDAGWKGTDGFRAWMGGEAPALDLVQKMAAECGEVWNLYGPTETTVWSSQWKIPEDAEGVRIGRPLGNTTLFVLDDALKPTPLGVPGELYIGGAGVTRGYHDRPELTAERFIDDPFSSEPGARLYRTGDSARFLRDGTIEYLGRLDNQVKIRGFRIELGEIEARLTEHDAIRQAVVLVDGEGVDARLVAYVAFAEGRNLTPTEVRFFLRDSLPDYMIPSLMVEVEAFPLTPSGKLDRKALASLRSWAEAPADTYQEPETELETLIASVWKDLLGLERVGRRDNFFEIGGHSLLSVQVVSYLERRTGKKVDPRAMFFQTLEQVAKTLE